jgi:hypothetical protein
MNPTPSLEPDTFPAIKLNGVLIGQVISFDWHFPSGGTSARVTGELRQIYHTGSDTVVQLCDHENPTGDLDEFVLTHADRIHVEP